jgi:hypothetical protein
MAKKSKRNRSRPATRQSAITKPEPVEAIEPVLRESSPKPATAAKPKRTQPTAERMEDEYTFIIGDLRRVLILAAVMFILLISANLILSRIAF